MKWRDSYCVRAGGLGLIQYRRWGLMFRIVDELGKAVGSVVEHDHNDVHARFIVALPVLSSDVLLLSPYPKSIHSPSTYLEAP